MNDPQEVERQDEEETVEAAGEVPVPDSDASSSNQPPTADTKLLSGDNKDGVSVDTKVVSKDGVSVPGEADAYGEEKGAGKEGCDEGVLLGYGGSCTCQDSKKRGPDMCVVCQAAAERPTRDIEEGRKTGQKKHFEEGGKTIPKLRLRAGYAEADKPSAAHTRSTEPGATTTNENPEDVRLDIMGLPLARTSRQGRLSFASVPGAHAVGGPGQFGPRRNNHTVIHQDPTPEEPTGNMNPGQISNSNLVEATPVQEGGPSELEIGQEVQERHATEDHNGNSNRARWFTIILACFIVMGGVLMLVFLLQGGSNGKGTMESDHTQRGTTPMPEYVLSLLPRETVEDINFDTRSIQHDAYQWLLGDPLVETYSDARLVQRFALAVFYLSTDGDEWFKNENWLSYDHHECDWFYTAKARYPAGGFGSQVISSALLNGFVEALLGKEDNHKPCVDRDGTESQEYKQMGLFMNNLRGQLPRELSLLTGIQFLGLAGNSLTGTIAPNIGQMKDLAGLMVSTNGLTGTIPPELFSIQALKLMVAGANGLAGSLPTEIGLLTELDILMMDQNYITGPMPSQVGQLRELRTLVLRENDFTGTIPTQVGRMNNMWIFLMGFNGLTGPIPSQLGQLSPLDAADPNYGGLSSDMPEKVRNDIRDLWQGRLEFTYNFLTGALPRELGLQTSFSRLWLGVNMLSGQMPSEVFSLPSMYEIVMNDNMVNGTIPTEIALMTNLAQLLIYSNEFTGPIPTELGLMTQTTYFDFGFNKLTGTIPTLLGLLTNAVLLGFYGTDLKGQIPSELGLATSTATLKFYGNAFQGTIPSQLGMMTNVHDVQLQLNDLSGTIPSELLLMTKLKSFQIWNNHLRGSIPSEFGLTTRMTTLALFSNSLSGSIPTQLGLMSNAKYMCLFNNQLTGSIPSEVLASEKLQRLILRNNELTGEVPPVLARRPTLTNLSLSGNQFEGSIPSDLCGRDQLSFDCEDLCGCSCDCTQPNGTTPFIPVYRHPEGAEWCTWLEEEGLKWVRPEEELQRQPGILQP